jgi:hypothetical protein
MEWAVPVFCLRDSHVLETGFDTVKFITSWAYLFCYILSTVNIISSWGSIYIYTYNISHDVPMKLYRQYLRWFMFFYTTQQHPTLVLNGFDVLIHLLKVMLAAGSMSRPDMHGECIKWTAGFWIDISYIYTYYYICIIYICISNGICF